MRCSPAGSPRHRTMSNVSRRQCSVIACFPTSRRKRKASASSESSTISWGVSSRRAATFESEMQNSRYGTLLDAVRGVHWRARHTVSSSLPGSHRSTQRGSSPEFTEYRLYRQGDDPRRLDWRLLARSDRAYIRLATDRAILPTTIVLDSSRSMAFPVATRDKWRLAQEIAIGLTAVVHGDGDPVGVAVHDASGNVRVLAPRTRRGVVAEITQVVADTLPDTSAALAPIVSTLRTPRIAIITDLLGDADELLNAVRVHGIAHGEVHLIHIVAREEI